MAKDSSMDIISQFDLQEVRNAFEQTKKEVVIRYDLKMLDIEVEMTDDKLTITAPSEMALNATWEILLQKMINRNLSPMILDRQDMEKCGGNQVRYEIKLIKALDQETAKKITKLIRDQFSKAKSSIQGETVRVSSKSRDELQAIMVMLKAEKTIERALEFTNYR
jgi:cyclic-di-GMP-binding protein